MTFATREELLTRVDVARRALEEWLLAADERRSMAVARSMDDLRRAAAALASATERATVEDRSIGALDEAIAAVKDATQRMGPAAGRELADVGEVLTAVRRDALDLLAPVATLGTPAPFRASVGEPALHGDVEVPHPQLVARELGDDEDHDLDDEPEPSPVPTLDPETQRVRAQIEALAQDCLEDVGIMGSLRQLWDHEAWVDAEGFEDRLLAVLDALVALERPLDPEAPRLGLVRAAWHYATAWNIPDRGRSFALGFVLSCIESKVAMVWLSLALRRAQSAAGEAYAAAMALGSSPHVDGLLDELLLDDAPEVLAVALKAVQLRRRGPAHTGVLLVHPEPAVAHAAVEAVSSLDTSIAVPLLEAALGDDRQEIALHAASRLATLGAISVAAQLRQALAESMVGDVGRVHAARSLALLGAEIDGDALARAAAEDPELAPWLGWHGWPRHLPILLEAAQQAGPTHLAHRIGDAIQRITGVLFEPALNLDARSGCPALDVDGYRGRLEAALREAPLPGGRSRHGKPFSLDAMVEELSHRRSTQGHRRVLADELSMHTEGRARVDVETWVAAQRRALAALIEDRRWRSGA